MAVTPFEGAALALAAAACVTDLRSRRIPNVLSIGGAALALSASFLVYGVAGLGQSVLGWLVGCAAFLPFFLLGGMGAGDVKLLAALGAWLGPAGAFWTAVYGGLAGGPLAVGVALYRGYLGQSLMNLGTLLTFWRTSGIQPLPSLTLQSAVGPRLPYALPIAVGAVVVIWLR
jgi:prepilin peptidase CpaA